MQLQLGIEGIRIEGGTEKNLEDAEKACRGEEICEKVDVFFSVVNITGCCSNDSCCCWEINVRV